MSGIKIDQTAPVTGAAAPGDWVNHDVTVTLSASDNLSGVAATHYILDAGATEDGTSVAISGEGVHTLEYWSVDIAGNVEAHQSIQIRIDLTSPTISHSQSPAANGHGWNNTAVVVTFKCDDQRWLRSRELHAAPDAEHRGSAPAGVGHGQRPCRQHGIRHRHRQHRPDQADHHRGSRPGAQRLRLVRRRRHRELHL